MKEKDESKSDDYSFDTYIPSDYVGIEEAYKAISEGINLTETLAILKKQFRKKKVEKCDMTNVFIDTLTDFLFDAKIPHEIRVLASEVHHNIMYKSKTASEYIFSKNIYYNLDLCLDEVVLNYFSSLLNSRPSHIRTSTCSFLINQKGVVGFFQETFPKVMNNEKDLKVLTYFFSCFSIFREYHHVFADIICDLLPRELVNNANNNVNLVKTILKVIVEFLDYNSSDILLRNDEFVSFLYNIEHTSLLSIVFRFFKHCLKAALVDIKQYCCIKILVDKVTSVIFDQELESDEFDLVLVNALSLLNVLYAYESTPGICSTKLMFDFQIVDRFMTKIQCGMLNGGTKSKYCKSLCIYISYIDNDRVSILVRENFKKFFIECVCPLSDSFEHEFIYALRKMLECDRDMELICFIQEETDVMNILDDLNDSDDNDLRLEVERLMDIIYSY